MARFRVVALITLMGTMAACTTVAPAPGSSSAAPPTSITVATGPALSSGHPSPATGASISLSQPPGTYSVSQFVLCGQQFGQFEGSQLSIYPDVPKTLVPEPGSSGPALIVAVAADCNHGAAVTVVPEGAAKVTSMVSARDGKPLVVLVVPQGDRKGVITFSPAKGTPVRTSIG